MQSIFSCILPKSMMDQYDSQSWIDNTHLSHELLKKWMQKNQRIKCKYIVFELLLWFWHVGDRTYGGLLRWCFRGCAYYHSASLQITSLVAVLGTEVPGGGEIGLSSSYLAGFCLSGRTQLSVHALWLWGSNTKTWHFTLSSCFSVACNENFKTRWGQHIHSPAFALLRSSNGKVNS